MFSLASVVMPHWLNSPVVTRSIATALVVLAVWVIYSIVARSLRRASKGNPDAAKRWIVQIRNAALLVVVLGLVLIWAQELRTLAVSIVVIATAIVIAFKEVLMCFSGGMLRASAGGFRLGDRIEINGLRGDVADVGLVTTTLLEVGAAGMPQQHTGRTIFVPNSLFLTYAVTNETTTKDYVMHTFVVPVNSASDWQAAESALLESCSEVCGSLIEPTQKKLNDLASREGLHVMSAEPRVTMTVPAPERINLIARVPAPARKRGQIENQILHKMFERIGPHSTTVTDSDKKTS